MRTGLPMARCLLLSGGASVAARGDQGKSPGWSGRHLPESPGADGSRPRSRSTSPCHNRQCRRESRQATRSTAAKAYGRIDPGRGQRVPPNIEGWARDAERPPAEAAEPRLKIRLGPPWETHSFAPASTWAILVSRRGSSVTNPCHTLGLRAQQVSRGRELDRTRLRIKSPGVGQKRRES